MVDNDKQRFLKPHRWLIAFIGVIVPRRLRSDDFVHDWHQERETELHNREALLARMRQARPPTQSRPAIAI